MSGREPGSTVDPTSETDGAVDAVCFDLDDTLCRYTQSGAEVLERAFDRAGVGRPWSIDDYYDGYRNYLEESTDIVDLRRRCFADLAVAAGHDRETGRAVADAYADLRDREAVELVPGARDVIDALAAEYRLGLVTNGAPEMQRTKLETIGLDDRFETVVCAGYDAPAKPAAEPFDLALEALGSTSERTVYVGNSLRSDVAGANAAGLRSVWVPDGEAVPETPDPPPTYRLETLAELATPPW
ncbi:HAD family hydrolase [Haloterrigena alkaliphila]|uniref:HAD family hydrolase n=1 Tax=Haloterrigena alkaliphila TaxID=2816475 RepID=A0A8A2VAX9_9EURY|nr:HAD family hydrolase [Haloterrigena alkaliphila]QSW99153.1 HAD family hydrolase [Haloterrigena alkaliphila]